MKKLSLLFIALFSITSLMASTNDLVIYSENGERFNVIIDGVRQNARPTSDFEIRDLRRPAYNVEVVFANPNMGAVGKSIYLPDLHREYTYAIVHKKGQLRLRQMSNVPKNARVPNRHPGNAHNHGKKWQTNPTAIRRNGHGAHAVNKAVCYVPVHQRKLDHFLNRLDHTNFDSDRLALSRHFAANNCLTSNQVHQIMTRMSFESTKLELAKFAYAHTLDPERYYVVHNAFHFASTSRRLNSYVDHMDYNNRPGTFAGRY